MGIHHAFRNIFTILTEEYFVFTLQLTAVNNQKHQVMLMLQEWISHHLVIHWFILVSQASSWQEDQSTEPVGLMAHGLGRFQFVKVSSSVSCCICHLSYFTAFLYLQWVHAHQQFDWAQLACLYERQVLLDEPNLLL